MGMTTPREQHRIFLAGVWASVPVISDSLIRGLLLQRARVWLLKILEILFLQNEFVFFRNRKSSC